MTITVEALADLTLESLAELGRMEFTQLATELQDYVAARELLKSHRMKVDAGDQININVQHSKLGTAAEVPLYSTDSLSFRDTMGVGWVPWRHVQVSWPFELREVMINRRPAKINDIVQTRRIAAMLSWVDLLETRFWGLADPNDSLQLYGVMNYIVYNSALGFNGGIPTGYSNVANIDPTDPKYSRWKNFSGQFTAVSRDDLVKKVRQAYAKCGFRSPYPHPEHGQTARRYGHYVPYSTLAELESLLEDQNSNLGNDVAAKDGRVMFRGVPVTWVPKLDEFTSSQPWYGIDWGKFKIVYLEGDFMRQTGPKPWALSHNAVMTWYDTTMNPVCYDRRRQFVLAKSDPSAEAA